MVNRDYWKQKERDQMSDNIAIDLGPDNQPKATKEGVATAMFQLICNKTNPTQENIRKITGGSMSTVKKYRDQVLIELAEQKQLAWPNQVPEEFIESAMRLYSAAKMVAWKEFEEFKVDVQKIADSATMQLKDAQREIQNIQGQLDGCLNEISITESRNIELEKIAEELGRKLEEAEGVLSVERARWQERSIAFENQKELQDKLLERMANDHKQQSSNQEKAFELERQRYQLENDRLMSQVDDLRNQKERAENSAEQKSLECSELRENNTRLSEALEKLSRPREI